MGFFRSEFMQLYEARVPKDDAQAVIGEFGKVGKVQFLDLNAEVSPLLLPYTQKIRECEESERSLSYLMEMCTRYNVKLTAPANIGTFSNLLQQISDAKHKNINLLQEDIQAEISQQETFVR